MLTVRKETVISVDELKHIAFGCSQCNTQVLINLAFDPPRKAPGQQSTDMIYRPMCSKLFETNLATSVESFRRAYRNLLGPIGDQLRFRIAAKDE
jgi:hypothetical protein